MKFKSSKKKKENKVKKAKSPSNSRTIPAISSFFGIYHKSLIVFVIIIFILTAALVALDLQRNLENKMKNDIQRENLTNELVFWEDFVGKHADYRDAYFKMSLLEYKLGNVIAAKRYVERGLALDPNSEDGKNIEEFLDKQI